MNPTPDVQAVAPVEVLPEATGGAQSEAATPASVLAAWARAACPNIREGERCVAEHARGRQRCNLLLVPPRGCPWAEHGPILAASEAVYKAYLVVVPDPVWRRARRAQRAAAAEALAAERSRLEESPGRRCRDCGVPVGPRRFLCDRCRMAHRRDRAGSGRRDDTPPNPDAEVEGACLASGQVMERLCARCGIVPLAPGKKLCDGCKVEADRVSRRRRQASYREKERSADGL